jgi:hypothetical protein
MNFTTQVIYKNINGINIISLTGGDNFSMGTAYGQTLQVLLTDTLNNLVSIFNQHGVSYEQMADEAQLFYDRISYSYQMFLHGIAHGSQLNITNVNILNGMETLNSLIKSEAEFSPENFNSKDIVHCAFLYIPPTQTISGYSMIGRNYDFPPDIYGQIASNLTITVLNSENKVSTAIIGMPGQIYCPSCTNANGLFMELNNGMPSGGYIPDLSRESMLINMLSVMQNSNTLTALHTAMLALESDYSLIVSTANSSYAGSFEYSSNATLGMKPYLPQDGSNVIVYTNFYLNESWDNAIPKPTDHTTWMGITRRNNLLKLARQNNIFDITSLKNLMETSLENGGAFWNFTIYQIIFQPNDNILSLRRSFQDSTEWIDIDLDDYYIPMLSIAN